MLKKLLSLLLSTMLILSAVLCVPFSASAVEKELVQTGAYSLRFENVKIMGPLMHIDKDYYCMYNVNATDSVPLYALMDTDESGYYVLNARNSQLTTGTNEAVISIVDEKETVYGTMKLACDDESELSVRLEAGPRYYVKLCYNYEKDTYGSLDLKLSYFADAEPDEVNLAVTISGGSAYNGSIDVSGDKDWIFVSTVNDKKYSITLENLNEAATGFVAQVYDSKNRLLGTVTTENEDAVTLELAKPSEVVSYYICVTGVDADVRGDYSVKMEEVKPKAVEIPLEEDYYGSITKPGAEGSVAYLKFTTIDKDAYYTISAKNINIVTHTWSWDIEVQVEILNAQDEKLNRLCLTEGQEKSATLKLQPNTDYYIKVYNNYLGDKNGGNFKINITYVLDPEKNESASCDEIKTEEKYYGTLAARGDLDWFKVTTDENTDYTFTLKNINIPTHSWSTDLRFRGVLYNDKNEALCTLMNLSAGESSERVTLEPNTTYYICVWDPEGTTGEYSFDLSVTVIIDEDAVGMENAAELPYDEEYYDSITNWEGDNPTDFLKFTTLGEPAYYNLKVKNINIPTHSWSGDYQLQVVVWNSHKEQLERITLGEGIEGSVNIELDQNTTYYVRIHNNENNGGNYKVLLTYMLDPEPNTMENSMELKLGEGYYGNIAVRGDDDWFKVTTDTDTDFILALKNINIPTHSWSSDLQFRAVIYNEYNEELATIRLTSGKESSVKLTLDPEKTYYIKVFDPEGTAGEYSVTLGKCMILGDITLDGNVKIQDATLIQKSLARIATLDSKQTALADVTEDGKVNIKDATAIQKYIARIETDYRVGETVNIEIE